MKEFHAKTVDEIEAEIRGLDAKRRSLLHQLAWRRAQSLFAAARAQRALERAA